MEIPNYQPFYIDSIDALRVEIDRLGVKVPISDDVTALAQPIVVAHRTAPNRFCAQPIAGHDAQPDGAPGELTRRRYLRYAEGGYGLIWMERTSAASPPNPADLRLHKQTVAAFRRMVDELRAAAPANPLIILQLVAGDLPALLPAARLAHEAGFDGIDLQCPRQLLPEAVASLHEHIPELLITVRLCIYEAVRGGFGVSAADYRKPDLTEPIRLAQDLRARGLSLLNITASSPILGGADRGTRARTDAERPDEHPLMTLQRQFDLARQVRESVPGLPVVGSGFSWLRQFVPQVAAGALAEGLIDFAGVGRGALAYPSLPRDVFAHGRIEPVSTCMVCFACSQLHDEPRPVGCVPRDPEIYGPIYRQMRRFDADQLLAGAVRCHLCEAAPCVAASPTRTNIPAFIQAFRAGDETRAYEIIRDRDPLPEITARFAPAWLESEGACIETTLTGSPVPILDLQYTIAWRARVEGRTGVRLPPVTTGRRMAVVGGGPAGVAATIRLLERGHTVHLYERSDRLGGVPERLLARHRNLPGPHAEIDAVLSPALAAKRLELNYGVVLGENLSIEKLRADHDVILLATGLWQDRSLGTSPGMIGALEFLDLPDPTVPARVAILAGGDAAMDAARVVQARGAREIFIVFGGPRSAMHWHMPESWFATPGVHAMMNWQPIDCELDEGGRLCGVKLRHAELRIETVLRVDLVIEAMELQISDAIRSILDGRGTRLYTAGALVNGGASVSQCVADGIAIADTIHRDLAR